MMETKKIFTYDFFGKKLVIEIGELAKQANGSVLVRLGETVVLCATVMKKEKSNLPFFPLLVEYKEKLYAVGKIPGGFIKREGRPSENAILASRMIDRPIRPLFPENFRNEVQIINTVFSVDGTSSPELAALLASSLALRISDIPFYDEVSGVHVGFIDNEFVVNPDSFENSSLQLTVAGTSDAINMVEASSDEISEDTMLEALMIGHDAIKKLNEIQRDIALKVGKQKVEVELKTINEELKESIKEKYMFDLNKTILIKDKQERYESINKLKEVIIDEMTVSIEEDRKEDYIKQIKEIFEILEKEEVRRLITHEKIRPDSRHIREIRHLSSYVDLLERTHGSSLFTRGQTQCLSVTTLGALGEHQILDGLDEENSKRFMLHYNFPAYSVGETGRYNFPSRREIGHGSLGEKALLRVIPKEEDFPYTIRVVSEILESNGSTSQASICAGTMSLMAAGVPIKSPVAGIAMGLISDENDPTKYTILTDIQGMEDHLGDMDFKVAGTKNGICAMQMDIKIKGITKEIFKEALEEARVGRLTILKHMNETISKPREVLSAYAPKIKQITVNPEKIKDIIGKGGETITKIILESSNVKSVNDINAVKVDLEDDGRVIVYHKDYSIIEKTINMIVEVTREVEEGKIYTGTVVKVCSFGVFVELWPGCEGLVHISHLADEHVEKCEDVVVAGDSILVKSIGYDKKGKLNLSRKLAIKQEKDVS
ncbi:MAG: polyribonucleotide nucleotidyltransferase [Bacilli bacterium]